MIYVVGNEQNYHFQVLSILLDRLGFKSYVKDYITSIIEPDSDDPQTGYITWTNIDHCWNWGSFLGYRHRWGFYEPQVQAGIQQGFIKDISMY